MSPSSSSGNTVWCHRPAHKTNVLHGIEGVWIELLDRPRNRPDIFAFNDNENDFNRSRSAFTANYRESVSGISQKRNELVSVLACNDPEDDPPYGNLVLNNDADIVPRRKSCRIRDKVYRVVQLLKDLAYDQQPYEHLEESGKAGIVSEVAVDENDP